MNATVIADAILGLSIPHPIRVAIDGFCGAGKTTLADEVALKLRTTGRGIIRATADDFQNPPELRWQLGARSPDGFFRHQIDFSSLRSLLLQPLGPTGSLQFHTSCYDVRASRPHLSPIRVASTTDVLLLDGLFLHSPAIVDCFELTAFVDTDDETCLSRALRRNQEGLADSRELERLYREKYIPGFRLYCDVVDPRQRASLVVHT